MWKYITILVLITALIFTYWNQIFQYNEKHTNKSSKFKLFTSEEISQYNGIEMSELYLVILGNIFNVTKGAKYYGPGETYHVFVGQDASKCFVTGKFKKEDVTDDVTGLNLQELKSLKHWLDFYKKEYTKIGKLIGKYYDEQGKLTEYGREIKKLIKIAEAKEKDDMVDQILYPPCNVEWDREKGTRVWCSNKSGGIERSWIGVPRKYYQTGEKTSRCACIKEEHLNSGNIEQYENCPTEATSCFIKT